MEKIINAENLRNFAYVNDSVCQKPIRGIVISFFGLGNTTMYGNGCPEGDFWAKQGILYVVPYTNPWAWMNDQAVAYTDEIIDVLFQKHHLPEHTPIVSTGGSMGGQSALVYTVYAKRQPVACVANCPVCDVVFHYTERQDLPRTLYSALYHEEETLEDGLKRISPLHLIDKLPNINYHIFHCTKDMDVNMDAHSKKFVAELEKKRYAVTFDMVEGRGHCDLTTEMQQKFAEYVVNAIDQSY